jgi:hypothetical protein
MKTFDYKHKLELMHNLVNYFGLNIMKHELCALYYILRNKTSNNWMIHLLKIWLFYKDTLWYNIIGL